LTWLVTAIVTSHYQRQFLSPLCLPAQGSEGHLLYVAEKLGPDADSHSVEDWDQLCFSSKFRLSTTVLRRGCVCHGKLSLRCCNSLRNILFSLMHPLANLGFAREHITIMTDKSQWWNLPTKENIVGPTCEVLHFFLPLHFVS